MILKEEPGYEVNPEIKSAPLRVYPGPKCLAPATQTPPQGGKNRTLTHPGAEQALWCCVTNIDTRTAAKTRCSGEQSRGVNTEHVENKEVKIKRQGKTLNMIYMYIFT